MHLNPVGIRGRREVLMYEGLAGAYGPNDSFVVIITDTENPGVSSGGDERS